MKHLLLITLLLTQGNLLFAQVPTNLEEALLVLDKKWSDSLKTALIEQEDKYLFKEFGDNPVLLQFISFEEKLAYQLFFQEIGIDKWNHILHLTLDAFKRKLKGLPIKNEDLLEHYKALSVKKRYEENNPTELDSLNGIFIPANIKECILQLHLIIPLDMLEEIKAMDEEDFAAGSHMRLGLWIRNNWGLWRGSRLSVYFKKQGVYFPDNMSWIILISYHRHIKGKYLGTKELFKFYGRENTSKN